jgi:RNA recognition motif-containing protein
MKREFAFVEFDDHHCASEAMSKMDGKEVSGHKISVQPAQADRKHSHGPTRADVCYNCGQKGHWYLIYLKDIGLMNAEQEIGQIDATDVEEKGMSREIVLLVVQLLILDQDHVLDLTEEDIEVDQDLIQEEEITENRGQAQRAHQVILSQDQDLMRK